MFENDFYNQIALMIVGFFGLFIGCILTGYAVDKLSKKQRLAIGSYNLRKLKYFFVYYQRRLGEIKKFVFWVNVLNYVSLIAFISLWIPLIVIQSRQLQIIVTIIVFVPGVLAIFAMGYHQHYADKAKKVGNLRYSESEEEKASKKSLSELAKEAEAEKASTTNPWDKYKAE